MPVEPTEEGRASIPGEVSPIALLAGSLKADTRLREDEAEVVVVSRIIEVRHLDAFAIVVRVADLAHDPVAPYLDRLTTGRAGLLLIGHVTRETLAAWPAGLVVACLDEGASAEAVYQTVNGLLDRIRLRRHDDRKARWINRYRYELGELVEIARALGRERNLSRLLHLILERSRYITGADAGSIYVVESSREQPSAVLRFKTSQNESVAFESSEFTMNVSTRSIAGAAVVTRDVINIPDVGHLAADSPYGFDSSFDLKVGYQTRSMIAVPMISAEDAVIGVIQLINKKRHPDARLRADADFDAEVLPFDQRSEELLETLASQAGIALENALLYDEIQRIFEGFVHASVQAIEARDPTTSGHSLRVSMLSCGLAEVVDRTVDGPYATSTFTRRELKELEYAALLHDFGKIGVREQVLVKAKKLYPHELETVVDRFAFATKALEADLWRAKAQALGTGASRDVLDALDAKFERDRDALHAALGVIRHANEPTVLTEGDFTAVAEIASRAYRDERGDPQPLLTPAELASLQVRRGSLTADEMRDVRSHVVHTFNFLSKIPWGKAMAKIPLIAGAHHEKLDGTGYPAGTLHEHIPIQSRIMTIADIFDALTASDRPYKKAVPVERALKILGAEVRDGHIDAELFRIFVDAQVYAIPLTTHSG
jgi:HD-GYP domain-containing protein (c-di-GMP phosphodiesterase class II)